MPFPVRVGELEIPNPRGLGFVIARELSRPDPVLGDPFAWLNEVFLALAEDEIASVVASLLNSAEPRAQVLGRRLVASVPPLVAARLLAELPPATLFQVGDEGPIDVSLARRASAGALGEAALRQRVLEVLRIEGDVIAEAHVLAREGEEAEILAALPALLQSGSAVQEALSAGVERSPALRSALQERSERDQ